MFFFFNDTATTEIYTLSLHDALPILLEGDVAVNFLATVLAQPEVTRLLSTEHFSVDGTLLEAWASIKSFRLKDGSGPPPEDRKSTRLNSSHANISYAVFCLKKKEFNG